MVATSLSGRAAQWVNIPAFLAVALWGSTYLSIKITVPEHFSALSLAGLRVVLGAAALFVILAIIEKDWKVEKSDLPLFAVLGVSGLAVFQIFFIEGLRYSTASNVSVVVATSPLFAAIVVALTRVDDLRLRTVAGTLLALTGIAFVSQRGLDLGAENRLLGDVFTLIAAIGWGIFVAVQMPLFKRYSPLKVMTWATIFGSVFILPFTWNDLAEEDWGAVSMAGWGLATYYVVISGVVATILWSRGIKNWGPAKTSVYSYLNPLFGILSGVLFLGERMAPVQVAGTLAVFIGLALARK